MTNQSLIDNNTKNIIKRYTVFYKIIFQYSIYFVPLLLWLIWAFTLQSNTVVARNQLLRASKIPSYTSSAWIYKATRISDEVGDIFSGFGHVKILWWELQATWNIIIGRNNLISLGGKDGIILPNRPYIINLDFTEWIQYFNKPDYNPERLKWVMDNRLLSIAPKWSETLSWSSTAIDPMFYRIRWEGNQAPTNMEEVLRILQDRMFFEQIEKGQLESAQRIEPWKFIKDNNLECLFWLRFIDFFCDANVNKMIKTIAWIDLEPHWADLLKISEKILDWEQTDSFCSNLMINILKKPYPNAELDEIMYNRCKNYAARYELLKRFLWIQNEIETNIWVWEDVIQWNIDFNIFKLVSTWQKIYIKHKDRNLDPTIVDSYLKFLNSLLNDKTIQIPQFYIEASYYFNNIYLKNILLSLSVNSINPNTITEVNKVLDTISSINKGNTALWVKWLEARIINENIKEEIISKTTKRIGTIQWFEQALWDVIKTFPQLRATNIETNESNRTARVTWVLVLDDKNRVDSEWNALKSNMPILIDFLYKDGIFTVSSIRTPENPDIDNILQSYMKRDTTKTLSILLYLIENSVWWWNQITLCWILKQENPETLARCDDSVIQIKYLKEMITFTMKNWYIVSGRSTNALRQTYLDNQIIWKNINQDRIVWLIDEITRIIQIEWGAIDDEPVVELDPLVVTIVEKFKTFLWVTPTSVIKNKTNNKYVVEFTLWNNEFATIVDIQNNYKLSPLIVSVGEKSVTITNFSLSLINIQQKRINQFVEDPIEFIKSVDVNRYNQIKKMQSDNTGIPAQ